jgi:hypothetical protein
MATFLDLANAAGEEIGSLGIGELFNADEIALCMNEWNRMVAEWSTARELLWTVGTATYNLSANKQSYQIGPGATDFNTARPVLIQSAAAIMPGTTIRIGLDLAASQAWAALREKGLTGILPDLLYCDYGMPIALLNFHPVPSAPITVELYAFSVMQQIVNVTDVLNFPPGYENALKYNLAVKICSSFGMPLQQQTVQQAISGKAAIAEINANLYRGALGTANIAPLPTEGAPMPPQQPPPVAQAQ